MGYAWEPFDKLPLHTGDDTRVQIDAVWPLGVYLWQLLGKRIHAHNSTDTPMGSRAPYESHVARANLGLVSGDLPSDPSLGVAEPIVDTVFLGITLEYPVSHRVILIESVS